MIALKDEDNSEIARTVTSKETTFNFNVISFETYSASSYIDGFKDTYFEYFPPIDQMKTSYKEPRTSYNRVCNY